MTKTSCQICGSQFEARRGAKTCSARCRKAASRKSLRQKEIDAAAARVFADLELLASVIGSPSDVDFAARMLLVDVGTRAIKLATMPAKSVGKNGHRKPNVSFPALLQVFALTG